MAHAHSDESAGTQARADEGEELTGGEIEGGVGLAVRVAEDRVVPSVSAPQGSPRVFDDQAQLRTRSQAEVAPADVDRVAVELHAVDAGRREVPGVGARGRAGDEAEDRHGPGRAFAHGEGRGEELVPDVADQHAVGSVQRVGSSAFVELESPLPVGGLHDGRVLVRGVCLVQDPPAVGFDDAGLRTSIRLPARRARSRSWWPRRSSKHRRTGPAGARRRSRCPGAVAPTTKTSRLSGRGRSGDLASRWRAASQAIAWVSQV